MRHIEFNGKNSEDMGLIVENIYVNTPQKNKIIKRVPFSNGVLDFSYINGIQNSYENRQIEVQLAIKNQYSKYQLQQQYNKIYRWLYETQGQAKLKLDSELDYYYNAEVIDSTEENNFSNSGRITVFFTAYPFKISEVNQGENIWNTFNFYEDYFFINQYVVTDRTTMTVHNAGVSINPSIEVKGRIRLIIDGIPSAYMTDGIYTDYSIILPNGTSKIIAEGNGSIKFIYKKETI